MYNKNIDIFKIVVECGSFSAAAERLYMSKTAVIKHINLLERDLGMPLLIRTNHGIRLTPAGKVLYQKSEELIKLTDRIKRTMHREMSGAEKVIRLGISPINEGTEFLKRWNLYSDKLEGISLHVESRGQIVGPSRPLDGLGSRYDILEGHYYSETYRDICRFYELYRRPIVCIVPDKHPLYQREELSIEDFQNCRVMLFRRGEDRLMDKMRAQLQKVPGIELQDLVGYSLENESTCIANNILMLGVEPSVNRNLNLKYISVKWDYYLPYGFIYAEDCTPSVERFIQILEENEKESAGC